MMEDANITEESMTSESESIHMKTQSSESVMYASFGICQCQVSVSYSSSR